MGACHQSAAAVCSSVATVPVLDYGGRCWFRLEWCSVCYLMSRASRSLTLEVQDVEA